MKELLTSFSRRRLLFVALATLLLAGLVLPVDASTRYYRYINDDGVTVLDSRVPPEYVKNGYEVVTASGRVLEVVPPAPSEEEREERVAERRREAELAEMDRYLLRRYSSVEDIDAAKERRMASFEASMAILRGNAGNLESQIENLQVRAANMERSGRAVPQNVLDSLRDLQIELEKIHKQMEQRELEQVQEQAKFQREKERFLVIKPDG